LNFWIVFARRVTSTAIVRMVAVRRPLTLLRGRATPMWCGCCCSIRWRCKRRWSKAFIHQAAGACSQGEGHGDEVALRQNRRRGCLSRRYTIPPRLEVVAYSSRYRLQAVNRSSSCMGLPLRCQYLKLSFQYSFTLNCPKEAYQCC
jgi:hypothetical protein